MIVVSDTSPLSGLAIVGQLSLLRSLYGQIVIPAAVAEELERGGQDDARISQVLTLSWLEVRQPHDLSLISELRKTYQLDRGESEAISLALELKADALAAIGLQPGDQVEVLVVGQSLVVQLPSAEEPIESEFVQAFQGVLGNRRAAYEELA